MATAMETEISRSLSALRDCWYLKIPDVPRFSGSTMRANITRPFDYIALCHDGVVGIECKETRSRTSLPLGNISEHQVSALNEFSRLGGYAYLLVNIRATKSAPRVNAMYALSSAECNHWFNVQTDRASIDFKWMTECCVSIPRLKLPSGQYGWDLRVLEPFCALDFDRGNERTLL